MRLVNIGLGEIADRLSILALKIAHAVDAGKDATHFTTERNALIVKVGGFPVTTATLEAIFTLSAVNGMLWRAEDQIREYRNNYPGVPLPHDLQPAVVQIAFRIQALNDQRADLVRALNQLAGTDLGAEKL